ncbi:hypothetical protein [Yinghuangia soli]|uniref:Protein-L-isoaspartate O-methyltransferase n=1 Tax=Yinghuangia soli TaxID=2908204 RepID=A0AA41U8I9_9ACTN|nr:hypothetical protein [Yinghuangia soli]MCF2532949.1 hypothetical protein [Yinghuangia soli]
MTEPEGMSAAERLAGELIRDGYLVPDWLAAWRSVDREAYIPARVWVPEHDGYRRLDRGDDPRRWRESVYTDIHLVTQVAEGPEAAWALQPTSSASMPRMVAGMLAALQVRPGHRVLEIGTGVGITAALLAARLGDGAVASVELDPHVAAGARAALESAGLRPHLYVGDGTLGAAELAPYDRLLSTCAVRSIPPAWLEQTRPGGRIVTPYGTTLYNGVLLDLAVTGDADGSAASGRVIGDAAFMWERGQGLSPRVMAAVGDEEPDSERTVDWDPRLLVDNPDAAFAAGLMLPGVRRSLGTPDAPDASTGTFTVWLVAADDRSWACVDCVPGAATYEAAAFGPRDLLHEAGAALAWWLEAGAPARTRFGVEVRPTGQYVWLDHPGKPLLAAPADHG